MQEIKTPTSDEMAMQRTQMASERTFMAWARTSLSLISFGFSIYKFMEYAKEGDPAAALSVEGTRRLGTTLVASGVLFLVLSSIQHWRHMKRASSPAYKLSAWTLSMFLAMFLSLLGLLALANMLFHIGPF
jgi:putative membrane protein